jgi:hypothetical protein
MTWIQGGPLLEVSFLIYCDSTREEFLLDVINKITKLECFVNFANLEINMDIEKFVDGYEYDFENSIIIHSIEIDFIAQIGRTRKGTIYISEIYFETYVVDLCFFGSAFDAVEWNQVGIKKDEYIYFIGLLKELYEIFDFRVGGIALEDDIKVLYASEQPWPNIDYQIVNLKCTELDKKLSEFVALIWNEKIEQLDTEVKAMHVHQKIKNDGIMFTNDWQETF